MMLNRACEHHLLDKHLPNQSSNRNTNSEYIRTTFCCIYFQQWACFIPFSRDSAVEFEQVNVLWVPPYQFMNAEIAYCYNYWQMYKNPNEIAAYKKRLRFKEFAPKKIFFRSYCVQSQGTVFFRVQCFFILQKQLQPSIAQWLGIFFKRALAVMNSVYTMYLQIFEGC